MVTSRMTDIYYVHAQLPADSTFNHILICLQDQQSRETNTDKNFYFPRPFNSESTVYSVTSAQDKEAASTTCKTSVVSKVKSIKKVYLQKENPTYSPPPSSSTW